MAIVNVNEATAAQLRNFCEEREMDVDGALCFMLRAFNRSPHLYDPEDVLEFGKYRGERFEEVMKMDPGYVGWMHNTATGVGLTPRSVDFFNDMYEGHERPKRKLYDVDLDDDVPF